MSKMSKVNISYERRAKIAGMGAIRDIAEIMKERSINQEQLAHMIGVKKSVLARYINNPETISLRFLAKVAKAFDVPLSVRIASREKLKEDYK